MATPTNGTTEPVVAPPPKEPTPLDPPVVYYNTKWRVPPLIMHTQEDADALDPEEWVTNPPPPVKKQEYPKLFFNVNVLPRVIDNADDEAALGSEWRQFVLTQQLINAAQAKLDDAK